MAEERVGRGGIDSFDNICGLSIDIGLFAGGCLCSPSSGLGLLESSVVVWDAANGLTVVSELFLGAGRTKPIT